METARSGASPPRRLPIIGGHLALDFANTVDDPLGPARHDHAATYDDLVRWSARVGVVDDSGASGLLRLAARQPRNAQACVQRAHELRDVLNELFGAVVDEAPDVAGPWTRLRAFATEARSVAHLAGSADGPYGWAWPQADDLGVLLHPIASAASDLLVSEDLRRLKRCARCPWLFLDHSRNHSRRWCDMDDCGRAAKIELYVARRAARRAPSS